MCISQDNIGYAAVTNNPRAQWLKMTNVYFKCYISNGGQHHVYK